MIHIRVKVKPGARESVIDESTPGDWLAKVKSPPTDGKANEELRSLVAARFQCSKSSVTVKSGASARLKLIAIDI
jgi:uncharacterized protein YggU (UPF0235/DUF167 family)